MECSPDKIACLLAWCSTHGIHMDPRLEIVEKGETGISVFSRDAQIRDPAVLVSIPKSAVLSVKSCSLSDYIPPEPYGHGAHLALSLAVYVEILRGETSQWFGYLQSLPQGIVDLPLFWRTDHTDWCRTEAEHSLRILDCEEATLWVTGTEIDRELRRSAEAGQTLLEDVHHYYFDTAEPLLSGLLWSDDQSVTLSGFSRAYSLVSSRAFFIDAYHGLAMVPIADCFNHAQDNHVHLESDHDVCTVCGSLEECPHDGDDVDADPRSIPTNSYGKAATVDTCEMVSNLPIFPHSEVFNTYGEKLNNAQLLVRYGFALDDNENDCITWDWVDLLEFTAMSLGNSGLADSFIRLYSQAIDLWYSDSLGWAETDFVYNPNVVKVSANKTGGLDRHTGEGALLYLNGDGKFSHHLWLYCALLGRQQVMGATESHVEEIIEELREVARLLIQLEQEALPDAPDGGKVDKGEGPADQEWNESLFVSPPTPVSAVFAGSIRTVMCLCRSRNNGIGKGNLSNAEDVGEALDRLSPHMTRTRKAMVEVMSEKSLLESVESAWDEIGQKLRVLCQEIA